MVVDYDVRQLVYVRQRLRALNAASLYLLSHHLRERAYLVHYLLFYLPDAALHEFLVHRGRLNIHIVILNVECSEESPKQVSNKPDDSHGKFMLFLDSFLFLSLNRSLFFLTALFFFLVSFEVKFLELVSLLFDRQF